MKYFDNLLFALAFFAMGYIVYKRVRAISRTINLGRAEDRTDQPNIRLKNMLLLAFGQKKMFEKPFVGLLHFAVYAGFVLINVEVIEIIIDGLFGTHRVLAGILGGFYGYLINFFEVLALLVLMACVVFLIRRNITKVDRLQTTRHKELKGWAVLDANIILAIEIILMLAILTMNTADGILQSRGAEHFTSTGTLYISSIFSPIFTNWSTQALHIYERFAWWLHILGIFGFAIYVTFSKHLHIFMAFPNTYFADLGQKGKMKNMESVTNEVKIMLGQPVATDAPPAGKFGAKDVDDLTWKNLMDAYSCTECGRCTDACPANQTGKILSPRAIMMATRDRLEDIQAGWKAHGEDFRDEKSLLGDYIVDEELLACTSCNACVQECPIQINPLDIILQLRRYRVMEESKAPNSWNMMFSNLETSQAPWKFPASERDAWNRD